ncbi:MAG: hypothetical protein ACRD3W_23850 [Terriglobales bacterium]
MRPDNGKRFDVFAEALLALSLAGLIPANIDALGMSVMIIDELIERLLDGFVARSQFRNFALSVFLQAFQVWVLL